MGGDADSRNEASTDGKAAAECASQREVQCRGEGKSDARQRLEGRLTAQEADNAGHLGWGVGVKKGSGRRELCAWVGEVQL